MTTTTKKDQYWSVLFVSSEDKSKHIGHLIAKTKKILEKEINKVDKPEVKRFGQMKLVVPTEQEISILKDGEHKSVWRFVQEKKTTGEAASKFEAQLFGLLGKFMPGANGAYDLMVQTKLDKTMTTLKDGAEKIKDGVSNFGRLKELVIERAKKEQEERSKKGNK